VFYSAFTMLESLLPLIDHGTRTVLEQQRRMPEDDRQALVDRLRLIGPDKVLHGVLGGIFSEGIDLPGGLLKAAVLVGPALPRVGLERQLMQDWYQHQYQDGFGYAFLVPGMSKVVQAAGRVVRSPEDRGVVVLVGRRFRYADYQRFFPESWAPHIPDDVGRAVEDFWAQVSSAKGPPT
jgi:DNA excision repair protein ERCC-2